MYRLVDTLTPEPIFDYLLKEEYFFQDCRPLIREEIILVIIRTCILSWDSISDYKRIIAALSNVCDPKYPKIRVVALEALILIYSKIPSKTADILQILDPKVYLAVQQRYQKGQLPRLSDDGNLFLRPISPLDSQQRSILKVTPRTIMNDLSDWVNEEENPNYLDIRDSIDDLLFTRSGTVSAPSITPSTSVHSSLSVITASPSLPYIPIRKANLNTESTAPTSYTPSFGTRRRRNSEYGPPKSETRTSRIKILISCM